MPENCSPKDCRMVQRIAALEADNSRHKDAHSKIYDRLGKLETDNAVQNAQFSAIMEKLDRMDIKSDRMADKVESMERTSAKQAQALDELNERGKNNQARLDALEAKPGKRWNNMVDKFIAGIIGAIAAGLAGGIIYLLNFPGG